MTAQFKDQETLEWYNYLKRLGWKEDNSIPITADEAVDLRFLLAAKTLAKELGFSITVSDSEITIYKISKTVSD